MTRNTGATVAPLGQSSFALATAPLEEEKKQVVRINVPLQSRQDSSLAIVDERQQSSEKPAAEKQASNAQSVTAKIQVATRTGLPGPVDAKEGGQSRVSSNMGRRRNRINANLLSAEELEEKTKIEAQGSSPQDESLTENTERMTRNLRKRKRHV